MTGKFLCIKIIIIFLLSTCCIYAQQDSVNAFLSPYKFIRAEKNIITNPSGLNTFFEALYKLSIEKRGVVNISHIGDSHIQADFFSGMLRQKLQRQFGNAGRGLIFPYKVAKTNEPYNYLTSSNSLWESGRCVSYPQAIPTGLCGIAIQTSDRNAKISVKTFNYPGLDYGFNHLNVFHEHDSATFPLALFDTAGNVLNVPLLNKNDQKKWESCFHLPFPIQSVIIGNLCEDTLKQRYSRIYGIVLANDSSGVLYHTAGVNGAMFKNYKNAQYFTAQQRMLEPVLIIISLGTNEAQSLKLTREELYATVDTLIKSLQSATHADILLTLPQDSYKRKWRYNPHVREIAETLALYAKEHQLACWDYYSLAGGYKSCYLWKKNGLIRHDGLHLSRKGYELQGKLLYTALINAYNQYVSDRHP